ncbi:hypothetical protein M422DRAFT_247051 [Sphaerobolus stellatus SS14]|nr:hypothetical protein M422DRAFT_247051 [Sphaerobolus stellatus SS14]
MRENPQPPNSTTSEAQSVKTSSTVLGKHKLTEAAVPEYSTKKINTATKSSLELNGSQSKADNTGFMENMRETGNQLIRMSDQFSVLLAEKDRVTSTVKEERDLLRKEMATLQAMLTEKDGTINQLTLENQKLSKALDLTLKEKSLRDEFASLMGAHKNTGEGNGTVVKREVYEEDHLTAKVFLQKVQELEARLASTEGKLDILITDCDTRKQIPEKSELSIPTRGRRRYSSEDFGEVTVRGRKRRLKRRRNDSITSK